MKALLRETFNTLSLPLTVIAEWAQESERVKKLCNFPIEKISNFFNVDYNPDFIANHLGTAAGAYLFASLTKHQFNFQDKLSDKIPFKQSLQNSSNSIKATFASVACVTIMETWQMLDRQAQFDWTDFNSCMASLCLFLLINRSHKHNKHLSSPLRV